MNDYKSLFTPRETKDQRVFTAEVMQKIRRLQPADSFWQVFARWAFPALALSFGALVITVSYSVEPQAVSAETFVLDDEETVYTIEWVAPQ